MNYEHEFAYWMALSHLPNWGNEKINRLIIQIIDNYKISFAEFFELNAEELKHEFKLNDRQAKDIEQAKIDLPNYSFLSESLIEQGFRIIPVNSKEYSSTLKQNLKIQNAPPILYVKGNTKLLNEPSVAIVGSRRASERSLEFTRNIAKKCAENYEVVVSGFAKGVDKTALDATLEYNGYSIVVLPQGILTFGGGIKKYYKKIIEGDVLILSAYHPNAPWSVGLAMDRNKYIYGLAYTIYVAESDSKGGTWTGVLDGLKKGRKIFIRKPEPGEKNANNLLIMKGALPVDFYGNPVKENGNTIEEKLKEILSQKALPLEAVKNALKSEIEIQDKELRKVLTDIDFIDSKKIKGKTYYFLKTSLPKQGDLFSQ